MKSITLLYDARGFQSAEALGTCFSFEEFKKECERQHLTGSQEVVLRVILHVQRFVVIPLMAGEEEFFACHFPVHGELSSCPLGDDLQKIVYEVPDGLSEKLSSVMPRCHIIPDCAIMARYAIHRSRADRPKAVLDDDTFVVFIPYERDFVSGVANPNVPMSIFQARHGHLTFANAFQIHSEEDIRYYVIATKQKFFHGSGCLLCSDGGELSSCKVLLSPFFSSIEEVSLVASHSEPFMGLFSDLIL